MQIRPLRPYGNRHSWGSILDGRGVGHRGSSPSTHTDAEERTSHTSGWLGGIALVIAAVAIGGCNSAPADDHTCPDGPSKGTDVVRADAEDVQDSTGDAGIRDTSDTDERDSNVPGDAENSDARDDTSEPTDTGDIDSGNPDGSGPAVDPSYALPDDEILNREYHPDSPPKSYEVDLQPPDCDEDDGDVVVLEPGDDLQSTLNDPDNRIFCVTPGDYRGSSVEITESGTSESPRWLRYHNPEMPDDTHPWDMADPETRPTDDRVLMGELDFEGASWWRVDRIRFHQRLDLHGGSDHVVLNRLMFYRSSVDAGRGGVNIRKSSHNTVQNTVIGRIERTSVADTVGVAIIKDAHYNRVVNSEIFDIFSGDGIQSNKDECKGIVIQNNDIYLSDEYSGGTENAIDLKCGGAEPGTGNLEGVPGEDWSLVENNRIWGKGWNMIYHYPEVSGVVLRNNKMWELNRFVYAVVKKDEINFEHHFYDNLIIETGGGLKPRHIDESFYARNIFVRVGGEDAEWAWFGNPEDNTAARNVFIETDIGTPQKGNDVRENAYYDSEPFGGTESGRIEHENAGDAAHEDWDLRIKRITGPTTKTLPLARPTEESPHASWFNSVSN